MVICLEQGAVSHMAQLMPLPLTISCFSKIQTGFTFLVLAHPGSPGKRAVKRMCVCRVVVRCKQRINICCYFAILLILRTNVASFMTYLCSTFTYDSSFNFSTKY